jgi:inorganic pyrophosphatase
VPASRLTRRYDAIKSYADVPEITIEQVQHFFQRDKDLEPKKWVKVIRWRGVDEAHRVIQEACARAKA